MKKLFLILSLIFIGLGISSAQSKKELQEKGYERNVVALKAHNCEIIPSVWVNYPNNLGKREENLQNLKLNLTPTGISMNLPILKRTQNQPYSADGGRIFTLFTFNDATYEVKHEGYTKGDKTYKLILKVNDPDEKGMTMEITAFKNGSVQVIGECVGMERTIFNCMLVPNAKK